MKKLLLLTAFLNGLAWQAIIPVFEYPDEQAHFAQVQNIAENNQLFPSGKDTSKEIILLEESLGTKRDGFGNNKFTYHPQNKHEFSQNLYGPKEQEIISMPPKERSLLIAKEATHNPPLYYNGAAIFYRAFQNSSIFSRIYAARFFSLVLFVLTVTASFVFAKIIFKKTQEQLAFCTVLAFTPMFVFTSTGILPDPLTNLFFSLVTIVCLKIIDEQLTIKKMVILAILVILGALTRQQFLISLTLIGATLVYSLIKNKNKKFIYTTTLFILFFVPLTFLVPQLIYLRNLSVPEIGKPNLVLLFSAKFTSYLKFQLSQLIFQTWPWYIGIFKWLSLSLPHVIYQIINRAMLLAAAGLLIKLYFLAKVKNVRELTNIFFLIVFSFFYAAALIVWDFFFFTNHGFTFGIQGRYFFPLIFAHLALFLLGLFAVISKAGEKIQKYLILSLILGAISFNDFVLYFIASSYYDLSSMVSFVTQASQYKPTFFKGGFLIALLASFIFSQLVLTAFTAKKFIINKSGKND